VATFQVRCPLTNANDPGPSPPPPLPLSVACSSSSACPCMSPAPRNLRTPQPLPATVHLPPTRKPANLVVHNRSSGARALANFFVNIVQEEAHGVPACAHCLSCVGIATTPSKVQHPPGKRQIQKLSSRVGFFKKKLSSHVHFLPEKNILGGKDQTVGRYKHFIGKGHPRLFPSMGPGIFWYRGEMLRTWVCPPDRESYTPVHGVTGYPPVWGHVGEGCCVTV